MDARPSLRPSHSLPAPLNPPYRDEVDIRQSVTKPSTSFVEQYSGCEELHLDGDSTYSDAESSPNSAVETLFAIQKPVLSKNISTAQAAQRRLINDISDAGKCMVNPPYQVYGRAQDIPNAFQQHHARPQIRSARSYPGGEIGHASTYAGFQHSLRLETLRKGHDAYGGSHHMGHLQHDDLEHGKHPQSYQQDQQNQLPLHYDAHIRSEHPLPGPTDLRLDSLKNSKNSFANYPPHTQPLPREVTFEEICSFFPNHLWEDILLQFETKSHWTMEQVWRALPLDARMKGNVGREWNYLQQRLRRAKIRRGLLKIGDPNPKKGRKSGKRKVNETNEQQDSQEWETSFPVDEGELGAISELHLKQAQPSLGSTGEETTVEVEVENEEKYPAVGYRAEQKPALPKQAPTDLDVNAIDPSLTRLDPVANSMQHLVKEIVTRRINRQKEIKKQIDLLYLIAAYTNGTQDQCRAEAYRRWSGQCHRWLARLSQPCGIPRPWHSTTENLDAIVEMIIMQQCGINWRPGVVLQKDREIQIKLVCERLIHQEFISWTKAWSREHEVLMRSAVLNGKQVMQTPPSSRVDKVFTNAASIGRGEALGGMTCPLIGSEIPILAGYSTSTTSGVGHGVTDDSAIIDPCLQTFAKVVELNNFDTFFHAQGITSPSPTLSSRDTPKVDERSTIKSGCGSPRLPQVQDCHAQLLVGASEGSATAGLSTSLVDDATASDSGIQHYYENSSKSAEEYPDPNTSHLQRDTGCELSRTLTVKPTSRSGMRLEDRENSNNFEALLREDQDDVLSWVADWRS